MRSHTFLILLALILGCTARSQPRIGFAYYDLDRLYDTIPSLFYDDTDHTPAGRLCWNDARYRTKIRGIAETLDRMAMPLVGLYGVENERVVRDLISAGEQPYCYIHRTLNTFDGMDFALLYHGDRFLPSHTESGRGYLAVEGTLDGRPTLLLLVRGDTYLGELIEEARERTPNVRILCAGKLSAAAAGAGLVDALAPVQRRGRGNAYARGGWWLHDRILCDTTFTILRADIFARESLLDPRTGTPRATYVRQRYTGGNGRYFPIFLYIK